MSERTPNSQIEAAGSRFFVVEFDTDVAVKPAEVNPVDSSLFITDFYAAYRDVMPHPTALLKTWGINEHGKFFGRQDYKVKGEPDPGKHLQQTVLLGLVWHESKEKLASWQVGVVDHVDRGAGRGNRLHCLFQRLPGEWLGITRNFDRQLRETRVETLDNITVGRLYQAVRYLLSCSEAEEQAERFRKNKVAAAPKLKKLAQPKRSGRPLTVDEGMLQTKLLQIGFLPVPWRHTAPPADLQ